MIPQIQIPDFTGTIQRQQALAQQGEMSRLQALALQRAADSDTRLNEAYASAAPGIMQGSGPAFDNALLTLMRGGREGLAIALPLMQQRREQQALEEWRGGSVPPQPAGGAPAPAGNDPLLRIAANESGGNPNARNPNSSASGTFQIVDGTWNAYAPRLGLTPAQRNDPAAQRQVAEAIQADATRAVGRPLSPGEAYGAHFLGIGGLQAFLGADPNADAFAIYSRAAGPNIALQAFRSNPGFLEPGMTVGQVMANLDRRMGGGAPGAQGQPTRSGVDPNELRRIQAGLESPFPAVRQAAAARMQMLQFQMRDSASEPLEPVEGTDGRPVLVPRSQAAGRTPVRLPNTVVNNNPGESGYARERAKALAERVSGWEEAGTRSASTLSRLRRFEELNRQFTTGALANSTLTAGQLAQRLGLPNAVLEAAGIGRDQVASGEGMRSLTSQMLVGLIGSGGFPAQNFSNADREMLERALPNLANSPQGNQVISTILRASAERDREVARAWMAWRRENGDNAESVQRFEAERLPAIIDRDVIAPILQDAYPADAAPQSVPGPGGRGTAEPPTTSRAPVRVRTPEEARRLPRGTPILLPDGTEGVVP